MKKTNQDKIDLAIEDAIDFEVRTKNQVIAEVNRQNTIIKATSKEEIGTFLGNNIDSHIPVGGTFYQTIKAQYPLLELVIAGLGISQPTELHYRKHRILISVHSGVVLGIAPKCDKE